MAARGDTYENPVTGQRLTFLATTADTGGAHLEVETSYRPGGARPPLHFHPAQHEDFEVLEGEAQASVGGDSRTLRAGDKLAIPPGTPHAIWCEAEPARLRWRTTPALETEAFFETIWGLAAAGRMTSRGVLRISQMALTGPEFKDEFRLVKPAWLTQMAIFTLLRPVARLQGLEARHAPPPGAD
jgi:quercetin dioxygenase-like cupin family protein